ncbi:ribosome assembly protein RRB1 [Vigna unguiculata]|uniref:Ribosome assembly protein RRB1 n=1 Tax=Vigna unguiculata TaxID=3917 RepID=A0A4D6L540_VIGUN|nr:ribosome assembly protein RRB1 [Vigna unguiculata]
MTRGIKHRKKAKSKNKGSKKEGGSSSSLAPQIPVKVWQPGVDKLEEDEELQCDPSAYNSLHAFHIGWPCLSFDILHDSLGLVRTEFPHTVYFMAGTQAEKPSWNSIGIFKVSHISGKRREPVPKVETDDSGMDGEDSDDDDDSEEEDKDVAQGPSLQLRKVGHQGCINRIRSMPQNPHICAAWADTGHVQPTSAGTWNVDNAPFTGHSASVEDLQWSPTEPHVFASCSVDGNIAIWDIRLGKSPAASFKAHNADVNVISWNRLASCMLASGSDDGTISIRDLRLLKEGDSLVAHFEYHKHPITSIEWSPHEASSLAVSSADNQLTIWDLSLEKDEEEEAEFKAKTREQVNAPEDLPPQLLFIHQGQKDLKELHWHAQIPGMIVSTAADGFNILMPSNIQSTLPSDGAL